MICSYYSVFFYSFPVKIVLHYRPKESLMHQRKAYLFGMVATLSMLGFIIIATAVYKHAGFIAVFDHAVAGFVSEYRHAWLTPWVIRLTDLNGFLGATYLSLMILVLFALKGWYQALFRYLVITLGATGWFALIKALIQRTRPEPTLLETGGYAFPSGHTTMATAMALGLALIVASHTASSALRRSWIILALLWASAIGLTRLYLGVHWASDVLGGMLLGTWWVTALFYWWESHPKRRTTPRS